MTRDVRFYKKPVPIPLKKLAEAAGSIIAQQEDADFLVEDVNTLKKAHSAELSFFENKKYLHDLQNTDAGVCIVHPDYQGQVPKKTRVLLSQEPYRAYAVIAQLLYPLSAQCLSDPFYEGPSLIHPTASIGKGCVIGPYSSIGPGVVLGEDTILEGHTHISAGCVIGHHSYISAHTTIAYSLIGNYVHIHTGARIGQEGFGFHMSTSSGVTKIPQLGRVIIEDQVRIGANTTIDRGALEDTIIGKGTMIDNLVQIAHNVHIGRYCVIVAQVGIAGSSVIEDFCVIGGQAGLAGHLRIGKGTHIAAQSGVMRHAEPGSRLGGTPAISLKDWHRLTILNQRHLKKYSKEETK